MYNKSSHINQILFSKNNSVNSLLTTVNGVTLNDLRHITLPRHLAIIATVKAVVVPMRGVPKVRYPPLIQKSNKTIFKKMFLHEYHISYFSTQTPLIHLDTLFKTNREFLYGSLIEPCPQQFSQASADP